MVTFVLGVIFLVVVAPIWIVAHYLTRWRRSRKLSVEDERSLGAKFQVMTDLGLAGFGAWRLGHESGAAWAAIRRLDTPATRVAP